MFESDKSSPRRAPEIIPYDKSSGYKGPDGKFYPNPEDLRRAKEYLRIAEEEWPSRKTKRKHEERKPPDLINQDLINKGKIPYPPPTSLSEEK